MPAKRVETALPACGGSSSADHDDAGGDHAVFHGCHVLAVGHHVRQQSERVCKITGFSFISGCTERCYLAQ